MQYDFVGGFGLSVCLWPGHCGESGLYPEPVAVLNGEFAVELSSIIRNEYSGNAEPGDDVSPYDFLYLFLGNGGKWFCFDPFCEVVNCHN